MSNWLESAAVVCSLLFLCGCCTTNAGQVSKHFDGSHFVNPEGGDHTFSDSVKWLWEMETVEWPEWVEDPPQPPPVGRAGPGALRVTYVNHATVLIQVEGHNILTDPIWSTRAGPTSWLGVKRVRAPGVKLEQLPEINYVLISHDHYDHLDLPTLERLWKRDHPKFFVGLGVGKLLQEINVPAGNIIELDWWQAHVPADTDLRIVFVPARHTSGRVPFCGRRTLWGGFIIDEPGGQIYYAGDTGFGHFVPELAARFDRIRLAILPIGSYEKRWFMKSQHMNPDDAVLVHQRLRVAQSMGIHYGTFAEHPEQSIDAHEQDLAVSLAEHGVDPSRFWVLGFGEGRAVPPLNREHAADTKTVFETSEKSMPMSRRCAEENANGAVSIGRCSK